MSTPLPSLRNSAYNALMADMLSGSGANGGFQLLNAAVTGNTTALVTGGGQDSGVAVGTNLFGKYNSFNATAALGTDIAFYNIARGATSGNTIDSVRTAYTQGVTGVNDTWNLSSAGVLNYTAVAAVPETDSLSMALLGMGLMGFVARRRRNTNV